MNFLQRFPEKYSVWSGSLDASSVNLVIFADCYMKRPVLRPQMSDIRIVYEEYQEFLHYCSY